jgi:transglutaminase-like putative cysteine protease
MRLRISHLTSYRYQAPANSVIQILRLTPRSHDNQYVARWHIDISADCRLDQHEDAFGNITHTFAADGPFTELAIRAEGEVETRDSQGIMHSTVERFPASLYLRETLLTKPDAGIAEFAAACRDSHEDDPLEVLHLMLDRLHGEMIFDTDPTHAATTAAEAFSLKRGVCQDFTHIFIAASRQIGIPARYISGYFRRTDGVEKQDAGHAWAEAFVPEVGWIAFDPTNGICATESHVRVAMGLDYLSAAPVRGTCYGGRGEALAVAISVAQAAQQIQN